MAEYQLYSEEQIEAANNADLLEFVRLQGFVYETKGKEIHVKGYGGLYINPEKNAYTVFSQSIGGKGALHFAQNVMGYSFKEAMQLIVGSGTEIKRFVPHTDSDTKKKPDKFIPPEKAANYKRMYAYLINTRKLSPEIINDFVKQGVLYQGINHTPNGKTAENAVFLHKNKSGVPTGGSLQGLSSEHRFKMCLDATEDDNGFVYHKGNPQKADTVYIFEAPIDLMSFVQLHPEIENADFVAMGGLKPTIAEHYINSGKKVVSCVDNDEAGQKFNNRILRNKMLDSITATGDDIQRKTYPNRKPPIEYIEADVNGKHCSFFLSKNDYAAANQAGIEIKSAFIWVNKSNFTINNECNRAFVKDFNELLKLRSAISETQQNCKALQNKIESACIQLNRDKFSNDFTKY